MESASEFIDNRTGDAVAEILKSLPEAGDMLRALLVLSAISEQAANPIFSRSDAIGTLMRRKLEPVFDLILQQIKLLTATV